MEKAKPNCYANIILENSEDLNNLWKSINNILHRFPVPSLSENPSLKTICEKFLNFFVDKITIICLKFPDDNDLQNVYPSLDINFFNEYFDFGNRNRDQEIIHEIKQHLK